MAHLRLAPLVLAVLLAVIGTVLALQRENARARPVGAGLVAFAVALAATALLA
jgi:hypothetical protein